MTAQPAFVSRLVPWAVVVPAESPSLSLDGVTKRWPGADRAVLDDVSLVVEHGTAVHLSGPNGVGKTTLLRIAVGLIRPEQGRIRLGALDVEADRTAFQRRVGFHSASSAGLYARLTVHDHLRLWSRLALMRRAERGAACDRTLDAFGPVSAGRTPCRSALDGAAPARAAGGRLPARP
jgi:osmoprotectant transport system ATP-binding protein